jgi:hypothetical protein
VASLEEYLSTLDEDLPPMERRLRFQQIFQDCADLTEVYMKGSVEYNVSPTQRITMQCTAMPKWNDNKTFF